MKAAVSAWPPSVQYDNKDWFCYTFWILMSEFTVFTPWSGDCFYISRFLSRVFVVICLQFKQIIRIWSFHLNLCFIIRKFDTGGRVWGERGRIKESESFDKEAKVKKSRNVWWRSAETGGVRTLSFWGEDSKSDAGGSLSLVFQTGSLREVLVFSHISVETLGNSDRRSRRL